MLSKCMNAELLEEGLGLPQQACGPGYGDGSQRGWFVSGSSLIPDLGDPPLWAWRDRDRGNDHRERPLEDGRGTCKGKQVGLGCGFVMTTASHYHSNDQNRKCQVAQTFSARLQPSPIPPALCLLHVLTQLVTYLA